LGRTGWDERAMEKALTQDGHLVGGERRLCSAHGRSDAIASHWSGAVAGVCMCEGWEGVWVAEVRVMVSRVQLWAL
jgi:hypothetical protein